MGEPGRTTDRDLLTVLYRLENKLDRISDRQDRDTDQRLEQFSQLGLLTVRIQQSEINVISEVQNLHRDLINEANPDAKKKRPMQRLARKRFRAAFWTITSLLLVFEVLTTFFLH